MSSNSDLKGGFGNLPEHVILIIYSWLDISDRYSASLTCKKWAATFQSPILWRHFTFAFKSKANTKLLRCLDSHSTDLKSVRIFLDPTIRVNCDNLCSVVTSLARAEERRLERIGIFFIADNPLMFQGNDILSGLAELFGPPDPKIDILATLVEVDLSGLNVAFTDILLNLLSSNNPNLRVLNIQNVSLVCKVSPSGLLDLVQRCRKLERLVCYHQSVSDEVMNALIRKDRAPLTFLSMKCQRHDRFHPPIDHKVWNRVVKALPKLRVALLFDHTIERDTIQGILDHQIPLVELSLRVMADLEKEMAQVDSYYSQSLEELTITTKGSDELQRILLTLIGHTPNLRVLHCYCGLSEDTIKEIFKMKPFLEQCTLLTEEIFRAHTPKAYVGQNATATVMDRSNYSVMEECLQNMNLS